jgi:ferredoxin
MGDNGLPVVDLKKCTGCGECVRVCPRNIIELSDYDDVVHVYCRSKDKGAVTKKNCSAGCIACRLCEKDDDSGAVTVRDNLSVIDYGINKAPVGATVRCPTKVIRISEPAPGYEEYFK